jgi:ABC-type transport system substrate-binding protein
MINNSKQKLIIIFAILVAAIFIMEPLYGNIDNNSQPSGVVNTTVPISSYTSSTSTPSWAYPTNTTGEPGYTGGTYKLAQIGNPDYFNPFEASTVCDFYVLDEIFNSATGELPNGTIIPCLATSWNETSAPANMTTFNPLTGATSPVKDIWTVHIRPGVQWDDWTSANAGDTYTYTNFTSFYNDTGVHYAHTYKKVYNATSGKNQTFKSIKMKEYYVQAADFILSWKIMSASADFSGSYIGVVNVVPLNNLTVEYYLSKPSATFVPYTLETDIIPYNIWSSHDYAGAGSGYWNETKVTASTPASGAYNTWDLGHVSGTGEYPGLVGTGPFMMNGGYGLPMGKFFHDDYWQIYENPNYFMQSIDLEV